MGAGCIAVILVLKGEESMNDNISSPVTKPIIWSELPNADNPSTLTVRQLIELCSITDWLIRIHSEMAQFCVSEYREDAKLHVDRICVISSARNGLILGVNVDYNGALALFREEGEDLVKLLNNSDKDYVALGDAVLREAGFV